VSQTIRLIAIDLDGTTLRRDGSISPRTVTALRRAMESGAAVAVTTGRLHGSAAYFARQIGSHGPIISSNGAVVRDLAGRTLLHRPLPHQAVQAALDLGSRVTGHLELFAMETLYVADPAAKRASMRRRLAATPTFQARLQRRAVQRGVRIRSFAHLARDGAIPEKLFALGGDAGELQAVARTLQAATPEPLAVTSSGSDNVEVTAAGVTKGSAVLWLAAHLGLSLEQVMVVGDSLNDLSMFELDCVRVAMGNAEAVLKERATYVTASHMEDGLARAVEHLVLKEAIA
jgi:5-amino-6-(5-phospho-D-ribitylamino)uracil phosphatase